MAQATQDDCTLDISSPNLKLVDHSISTSNNVVESCFVPKKRARFTRVRDEDGFICEFEGPVNTAELFNKDGKPYLLWFHLKRHQFKYFLKTDSRWTEITDREYMSHESYMRMLTRPDRHITIDVNKTEDNNFCDVKEMKYCDKTSVIFYPKVGYYARAVADGDTTIWKAANDAERCEDAEVYYNQNQKELVELVIRDIGVKKHKYYHLVKGKWDEVDKKTFMESESS